MYPEKSAIKVRENRHEDRIFFYMRSDKGRLVAGINLNTKEYEVIDYYVYENYRRQGHGKELFKFSVDHAKSIGARAIIGANIVSRESLDVVASVLGIEHISVENLGDYTPTGMDDNTVNRTKASLRYNITD